MKEVVLQGLRQAYGNLVHMVAEFLPRLLVMLVIVGIGLLVDYALKMILRAVLHVTRLDPLSEGAGDSLFWFTWCGFILIWISVLVVAGLQEQISRLFLLLPAIFVAILILFLGLVTANFLSRAALLAAVNAGYPSPKLLSWSIRFVIWALAVSMALEQVGVARQTVIAAFSIVFGAFMFGLAIAFGLGGKDLARDFLERNLGEKKREKYEEPQPL